MTWHDVLEIGALWLWLAYGLGIGFGELMKRREPTSPGGSPAMA